MTQDNNTTDDNTSGNNSPKSELDLTYSNFERSSSDYRSFEVVELDIKRTLEIIERVQERLDGEVGDFDSIHIVGYVCSGWEKSMYAELEKDAPHMDGEAGDQVEFSHFSAIPSRLSDSRELLSVNAPRTIRNTMAAPELEEKQRTTDRDRLHNCSDKLDEAEDWVRNADEELADRIKSLKREVRNTEVEE